jgi:hypothetical protein
VGRGTPLVTLAHPKPTGLSGIGLSAAEGYGLLSGAATIYSGGPRVRQPRSGTYHVLLLNTYVTCARCAAVSAQRYIMIK